MDCGSKCLPMVTKHYGKIINLDILRHHAGFSKDGVSLLGIAEAAENIGFKTNGVTLSYQQIQDILALCKVKTYIPLSWY